MRTEEQRELSSVIERISQTVDTKEIYLFGSFATGKQQQDSDFDLYVVLQPEEDRPIKAIQKIHYALADLEVRSVDVLANYEDIFMRSAKHPTLEKTILETGIKV